MRGAQQLKQTCEHKCLYFHGAHVLLGETGDNHVVRSAMKTGEARKGVGRAGLLCWVEYPRR